jgi:hypothetical protein
MSIKLAHWDNSKAKQEVSRRFKQAKEARRGLEDQWSRNEAATYGSGFSDANYAMDMNMEDLDDLGSPEQVNVAYTFKNLRFLHSQMSANPPSVAMRPSSSDQEDVRKADAADRVVRYMIRKYSMQENIDQLTLSALLYGTAALKTAWDPTKGDILEFNEETGELTTEGDIDITIPHTRNLFVDPDARTIPQIKWVIERIYMDYDEAVARWPEHEEKLKKVRIERDSPNPAQGGTGALGKEEHWNSVELLEYWETGLPSNSYMGRYCLTLADGEVLDKCRPSPFRFPQAGATAKLRTSDLADEVIESRIKRLPQVASLPYHFLTNIDVPNSIWGKSEIEFVAPLQQVLAQIDSAYLDNIRTHGVARLVVNEASDVDLDLTNSPLDVVKVGGTQAPYFMEVPNLMPEMTSTRNNMITGINDVYGVNESMFGQQSREQAAAAMQYATNQGNMIRRRVFNKYVLAVESIYKALLNLARKHWDTERTIQVLGKEKAFEALSLSGTDIDGGYDVVGEYGVTLSLDPISRRQEIMQLQPLFEKAGIPSRMSMKMLKLNELEGLHDKLTTAEDRQREIFEEQSATGRLIPPEPMMDHENMIAWALDYFMSAEFKYMEPAARDLCREHIKARIALAAQEKSGGTSAQPAAPGPAGAVDLAAGPPAAPSAEQPATVEMATPPIVNQ